MYKKEKYEQNGRNFRNNIISIPRRQTNGESSHSNQLCNIEVIHDTFLIIYFKGLLMTPVFFSYYKEVCPFLSSYEMNGCPKIFRRHSLPCHCPFHPGFYTTNKLPFRIPSLSGYPDLFIKVGQCSQGFTVYQDTRISLR